jgi:hypothetical protein
VPAARDAVRQVLAFVHSTAAWKREVTDREWEDLARAALLLAVFEQIYRSGILPDAFAQFEHVPTGWRAWAKPVCPAIELEDVAILGWAAVEDHASIRGRGIVCNPEFAQSPALRGADADLITDAGLLIDLKSTSTRKTCTTLDIWQLCGYVLADTNDDYSIRSVGLSTLRWRTRCSWTLDELLPILADEPVTVQRLRREFAAVLAGLRTPRERARTSRQPIERQPGLRRSLPLHTGVGAG